jgi:hypothetical protein
MRQRGERDHDNPTGLELELTLAGYVKGTASYRKEYARLYYHLKRGAQDSTRTSRLKQRYGLTPEQVAAMFVACDFKCQCCERDVKLSGQGHPKNEVGNVDHCHKTGKIRGILCNPCNQALGLLKDNPMIAVKYMERTL